MHQTEMVLRHLRKHRDITTFEAFTHFGCTRLARVIYELRERHRIGGYPVKLPRRDGSTVTVTRYYYIGERR